MKKIRTIFTICILFINNYLLFSQCFNNYTINVNHTTCGLNNGSIYIDYIDPCEQYDITYPSCISLYLNTCQDCPVTWDHIHSVYTIGDACDHINSINTFCNGTFPNNYHYFNDYLKVSPNNNITVVAQSASIQTGCSSQYIQGFSLWIDWNANGVFEQNELIGSHAPTFLPVTWSVVIPNVPDGIYTMRVRCAWATIPNDPCATYSFGETEDYPICVTNNIINTFSLYHNGSYIGNGVYFENLEPGEYILTNGSDIISVTINSSEQLTYTYNIHNVTCHGYNDGYIEINGNVSVNWIEPQQYIGNNIYNLPSGTYTAIISDGGCQEITSFIINQPELFTVNVLYNDLYCEDSTIVTFIPNGGTPPYNIPSDIYLGAGNHTYYSYDSNGCVWINNITINDNRVPENYIFEVINPHCYGDSAHIIFDGKGYWNMIPDNINPTQGLHTYLLIDTNGCVKEKTFYVYDAEKPQINTSVTHPMCKNDLGVITINDKIYNLPPGYHKINYEYKPGCIYDTVVFINTPPQFYFINNHETIEGFLGTYNNINIDIVSDDNYYYIIDCNKCYVIGNIIYFDVINQRIKINAISENNCIIEKIIDVIGLRGPWYPNSITYNDDGLNECFSIVDIGVKNFHLYIWSRWGEIIWETNNLYDCWHPSDKQDVYIFNAHIEYIDNVIKYIYGSFSVIK